MKIFEKYNTCLFFVLQIFRMIFHQQFPLFHLFWEQEKDIVISPAIWGVTCAAPVEAAIPQRSNLARKSAQARWSYVGQAVSLPSYTGHCERNEAIPSTKRQKLKANRTDWLSTRFCLRLEQDSSGAWWLSSTQPHSPLPVSASPPPKRSTQPPLYSSPADISLWLDLQTQKISP